MVFSLSTVGVFYYCCNANQAVMITTNWSYSLEIKAPGTELSSDEFDQMDFQDFDDLASGCMCVHM